MLPYTKSQFFASRPQSMAERRRRGGAFVVKSEEQILGNQAMDIAVLLTEQKTFEARRITTLSKQLSKREIQILQLVALGRSGGEIAYTLGLSEQTVKNHKTKIYRKLGVTNIIEALRIGVQAGLVEFP